MPRPGIGCRCWRSYGSSHRSCFDMINTYGGSGERFRTLKLKCADGPLNMCKAKCKVYSKLFYHTHTTALLLYRIYIYTKKPYISGLARTFIIILCYWSERLVSGLYAYMITSFLYPCGISSLPKTKFFFSFETYM